MQLLVHPPHSHIDPDWQFAVEFENGTGPESADLLRQRRLRQMQPFCRAPEVQFLGDCKEISKVPKLQITKDREILNDPVNSILSEGRSYLHGLRRG
jgi:hypothetical protein